MTRGLPHLAHRGTGRHQRPTKIPDGVGTHAPLRRPQGLGPAARPPAATGGSLIGEPDLRRPSASAESVQKPQAAAKNRPSGPAPVKQHQPHLPSRYWNAAMSGARRNSRAGRGQVPRRLGLRHPAAARQAASGWRWIAVYRNNQDSRSPHTAGTSRRACKSQPGRACRRRRPRGRAVKEEFPRDPRYSGVGFRIFSQGAEGNLLPSTSGRGRAGISPWSGLRQSAFSPASASSSLRPHPSSFILHPFSESTRSWVLTHEQHSRYLRAC